jgi:hypothetical protein
MKVLFVDHAFHKKTLSSNFFLDLLREWFPVVDCLHIDLEDEDCFRALAAGRTYELVVLWQLDFLAPAFLQAGCPTIVVPMYDGSANLPFEHWISMQRAFIVCFSRTLYERVTACGCRALLVKYYVTPCLEKELSSFDKLRVFLWLRRPEDRLDPELVDGLLGDQFDSLHIHNAPDSGKPSALRRAYPSLARATFTETRWNANGSNYRTALGRSNVFIAPRMSEGIGMTMLEAFSKGMLVCANDDSVHDEYISNWVTGILFNRDAVGIAHLSKVTARDIARQGWVATRKGYQRWIEMLPMLKDFMIKAAVDSQEVPYRDVNASFAHALSDAFSHGSGSYIQFLRGNVIGNAFRLPHPKLATQVQRHLVAGHSSVPILGDDGLFFGLVPKSVGGKVGFTALDYFSARLAVPAAEFSFKVAPTLVALSKLQLILMVEITEELLVGWQLIFHVNATLVARVSLPPTPGRLECIFPLPVSSADEVKVMVTALSADTSVSFDEVPAIRFFSISMREDAP